MKYFSDRVEENAVAKSKNVDQSLALTLKSDQLVSLMKRPIKVTRAGIEITLQVEDFSEGDAENVRRIARLCEDYLEDLENLDDVEDEDELDDDDAEDDEDDMEYEEDDDDDDLEDDDEGGEVEDEEEK
jgi:hypothetical protein